VRELLAAGADINHTKEGDDGMTALFKAALAGHLQALQALIDAGADVDKGNKWGHTPLINAAYKGNLEVVKALVGAKAKVNKAENCGDTALKNAIDNDQTSVIEYLKSVGAR
jgi:ankyrin repeat protein